MPCEISYMWSLKYDTNAPTSGTETEQTCGSQGEGAEGGVE